LLSHTTHLVFRQDGVAHELLALSSAGVLVPADASMHAELSHLASHHTAAAGVTA